MRSGHFSDTTKRTPAVIPIHRVIAYDPPQLQIKSPLANSIVFNQMQNITNPATGNSVFLCMMIINRITNYK